MYSVAETGLVAAVEINVFEVECMDVAGEVAKTGETDVDEQVSTASRDEENPDRGNEDGDNNDEDGVDCVGHFVKG